MSNFHHIWRTYSAFPHVGILGIYQGQSRRREREVKVKKREHLQLWSKSIKSIVCLSQTSFCPISNANVCNPCCFISIKVHNSNAHLESVVWFPTLEPWKPRGNCWMNLRGHRMTIRVHVKSDRKQDERWGEWHAAEGHRFDRWAAEHGAHALPTKLLNCVRTQNTSLSPGRLSNRLTSVSGMETCLTPSTSRWKHHTDPRHPDGDRGPSYKHHFHF